METPEGAALALRVAGPVPRAAAWAIDLGFRAVVYMAAGTAFAMMGKIGLGVMLVLVFGLEWFYPVLFEVYMRGATPGKKLLGLRVVHEDGTPVRWTAALSRNLLRAADFLPMLYGIGLVFMLGNCNSQRLGDIVAGTLVIHDDRPRPLPARPEIAASLPPPHPLTLQEQRAILDYAERVPLLTEQRADELAGLVPALTGPAGGEGAARSRLLRMAAYLLSGRQ